MQKGRDLVISLVQLRENMMLKYCWSKVDVHNATNVEVWIFHQQGQNIIMSWILKSGPLYCRYESYRKQAGVLNLLTDGALCGVYPSLKAAKSSMVRKSADQVPVLNP